jgi:hypothetical protein
MALFGLDAAGNTAYVQAGGLGTSADPYVLKHDLVSTEIKSAWVASTSGVDLVSGVTSKKLRVLNLAITATSGCTVQIQSGGSSNLTPAIPVQASGSFVLTNPLGIFETIPGEKLNTVVSSGASYQVMVTYREV